MENEIYCAIDFETSGLDTDKSEIIEFGWVTGTKDKILTINSYLIQPSERITKEIEDLTGISNDELEHYGRSHAYVFQTFFLDLFACGVKPPKYFLGYNAYAFDRLFFERYMKTLAHADPALIPHVDDCLKTEWIDVMVDIEYGSEYKSKKLKYLAYDHNIILSDAHRAGMDALATLKLFQKYPLDKILNTKKDPLVNIRASLTGLPSDAPKREWAKSRGFRFNGENKTWTAKVRQSEYLEMLDWAPTQIDLI